MSFLGASSSSPAPAADVNAKKEAIMAQVRNEIALANAQELMNKVNEQCYLKCITKPGESLSNTDQTCLSRCMDRYLQAFNIVSQTYTSRLARERTAALQEPLGNSL